jgi:hypothetical protein
MWVVKPLGSSEIEVFVCSTSRDVNIERYREMSYHVQCGLAKWAYSQLASQFKGRILSDKDIEALNKIFEVGKQKNCQIRVCDTSRLIDRMRDLKRGIIRTPAVVISGVSYQGQDEIAQATRSTLKP